MVWLDSLKPPFLVLFVDTEQFTNCHMARNFMSGFETLRPVATGTDIFIIVRRKVMSVAFSSFLQ